MQAPLLQDGNERERLKALDLVLVFEQVDALFQKEPRGKVSALGPAINAAAPGLLEGLHEAPRRQQRLVLEAPGQLHVEHGEEQTELAEYEHAFGDDDEALHLALALALAEVLLLCLALLLFFFLVTPTSFLRILFR